MLRMLLLFCDVMCLPAVELINLILFLSLVTSIRVLTFLLFYLSIKPTAFLFLTFFQLLTLPITLSSQYSSILRLAQRWDREDGGGAGKMGVGQGRWGWGRCSLSSHSLLIILFGMFS